MSIRDRKYRWVRRARFLMAVELCLSLIFDLTMIGGTVRKGQMLNCLLIVVITINILTGARLFLKLRGIKCASSIMAYVIWKIVQEVVMVPALVVFSFICVDRYLRSWDNVNRGVQILLVVWIYALYSLGLILFLGWLARYLWQLQTAHAQNNGTDKNETATQISFIDNFHSEADHQELLIQSTNYSTNNYSNPRRHGNCSEAIELREIPMDRPFVPMMDTVTFDTVSRDTVVPWTLRDD